MRKIAIFLLSLFLFFTIPIPSVKAQENICPARKTGVGSNAVVPNGAQSHTITFDLTDYQNRDLEFWILGDEVANSPPFRSGQNKEETNGSGTLTVEGNLVTWTITEKKVLENAGTLTVYLYKDGYWGVITDRLCTVGNYKTAEFVTGTNEMGCQIYVYQVRNGQQCYSTGCMTGGSVTTHIDASGLKDVDGKPYTGVVSFNINRPGWGNRALFDENASNGIVSGELDANGVGVYSIILSRKVGGVNIERICDEVSFKTQEATQACSNDCGVKGDVYEQAETPNFELCEQIPTKDENEAQKDSCVACFAEDGIWTAVGCIPTQVEGIIQTLIKLALGLGGGITLLLILAGAFRLSVSQGDPKAAEEAKEQITSAVIGLLFIIFSIAMLRFIGVQVLQIPGFGT